MVGMRAIALCALAAGAHASEFSELRLRAAAARAVREELVDSFQLAAETQVNPKVNVTLMQEGHALLKKYRAKGDAVRSAQTAPDCYGFCYASMALDLLEAGTAVFGWRCDVLALINFYVMGFLVLMLEQGDTFPKAAMQLGTMITSVGWGTSSLLSNDIQSDGLKLWHSAHGALSYMIANNAVNNMLNKMWAAAIPMASQSKCTNKESELPECRKAVTMIYAAEIFFATIIYTLDRLTGCPGGDCDGTGETVIGNMINSFYMTLISSTSVGYGDITPTSTWAQVASLFLNHVLTHSFGVYATAVGASETKELEFLPDAETAPSLLEEEEYDEEEGDEESDEEGLKICPLDDF